MPRGGRRKDRDGPERRCIATGESGAPTGMIRFARSPDGAATPDLAGRLPGRGVWLTADRAMVEQAVKKRAFARAFRAQTTVPEDLSGLLERLLVARIVETLGLARKAGQAITGFEKVRAALDSGQAGLLVQASDARPDGRDRLRRAAAEIPQAALLDSTELGLAFGRDFAIHAALAPGRFADRVIADTTRLGGFRSGNAVPREGSASSGCGDDVMQETGEPMGGSGQDSL